MDSADMIMKKLGFTVSRLTSGAGDNQQCPASLSFIYGIGTEGLSPFEQAISSMNIGESIEIDVQGVGPRHYFGQLYRLLCSACGLGVHENSGSLSCRFTFDSCDPAEPQEIVTAIAEQLKEGGCSSSCGCGCGGH